MQEFTKVIVTNKTKLTDKVYVIQFYRNFNFLAGQIIGITNRKDLAPRLYSICSAPANNQISILFSIKEDGELTPPLATVESGNTLWITKVQGKFIYNNEPAWWIATGTGIAPFYSMFKSGQTPLKLIQGGRQMEDFYFQDELKDLPDYIKCSSQYNGEGFYKGRLSQYLNEIEAIPTNINYYLCGSAEMVVDVRNLLISKRVPYNNIITEIYF